MQSKGKGVAPCSNIILQSFLPEHLGEKTEKESHCLSKMNTLPPYISNANLHNAAKPQSEAGYENVFLASTVFHKLMVWVLFFFCNKHACMMTQRNTPPSCANNTQPHAQIHTEVFITCHREIHRYWVRASAGSAPLFPLSSSCLEFRGEESH